MSRNLSRIIYSCLQFTHELFTQCNEYSRYLLLNMANINKRSAVELTATYGYPLGAKS